MEVQENVKNAVFLMIDEWQNGFKPQNWVSKAFRTYRRLCNWSSASTSLSSVAKHGSQDWAVAQPLRSDEELSKSLMLTLKPTN